MYKKIFSISLFFIYLICLGSNVFAIDIYLREEQKEKLYRVLDVSLGFRDMVCCDSIRLSIDSPEIKINRWEIKDTPVDEYIASLKVHKKIYKNNFAIKLFLSGNKVEQDDLFLCFSCFMIDSQDRVHPVIKRVSLNSKKSNRKKSINKIFSKKDFLKKTSVKLFTKIKKQKDRLLLFFNIRIFVALFLLLLFIGFVFLNILSLLDAFIIIFLLVWILLVRRLLPYFFIEFLSGIWFLIASISFFTRDTDALFLKRTRLVLGFLCAASILPALAKAYLSWLGG